MKVPSLLFVCMTYLQFFVRLFLMLAIVTNESYDLILSASSSGSVMEGQGWGEALL